MIRMLFASIVFAAACSGSAQADQVFIGPQGPSSGASIALGVAPAKVRAPYDVQIIRDGGGAQQLPTFAHNNRFYVQGNAGERYIIRVTNPTPRRVEAVVSVDGLDVIDGEAGDLRKRGYVVPPHGDVRIEGFRTSTEGVATFRFSGVDDSYAGKKGAARNVGVIAVAIFEETPPQPEQQIIVGSTNVGPAPRDGRKYDYTDDLDRSSVGATGTASGGYRGGESVAKAKKSVDSPSESRKDSYADAKPAKRVGTADRAESRRPEPTAAPSVSRTAPPPPHPGGGGRYQHLEEGDVGGYDAPVTQSAPRTNRPGLGTEFGEHRYSAASYTRFVRNGAAPIAVAELRYNNQAGLTALGIHAQPLPSPGEIMTRETADPFPGDGRFATRPR